ncbi:glycoside hydrolase family 18 protein [Neolentinus lepideus HHB14362 ss-1]|uniref:Glycoside hydrolase family 18 protein n=1 Tax=Neolentinus lepideus HHB14362 ss-1 TaxID=1314782 RepID=A0A165RAM3_9AGAM|nr:glycoside hydrolase family 18 protein [Neolentinus lepideus HHB14362 ss-1]
MTLRWSMFLVLCVLALCMWHGTAVPLLPSNTSARGLSTTGDPHFVMYTDRFVPAHTGPPTVSEVQGFNVIVLSFLLIQGPYDKAAEWAQLTPDQRTSIKSQYAAAGIKLLVSAFGSTDVPTSAGVDPVATAYTMAGWVKQYDLDGIDVDYEDLNAMTAGDGKAEAWLTTFTRQLRVHLPQNQYIITHAPLAPWFSPGHWGGGGYLTVHKNVGNLIDWYNVQYYNQGLLEYITCPGLITTSSPTWPQTAVFQIAQGVPLNKLVIGKPALPVVDASTGWMDPVTLSLCLREAREAGWNAGVMTWQYPEGGSPWITVVKSQAWPQ